jgi:hypothetical protein
MLPRQAGSVFVSDFRTGAHSVEGYRMWALMLLVGLAAFAALFGFTWACELL